MEKELTYNERTEDECDRIVADEAYKEYIRSDKESNPITELWEELNI